MEFYNLPAEWHKQSAIFIAWPHNNTDWADMLEDITACYTDIVDNLVPEIPVLIAAPDKTEVAKALANLSVEKLKKIVVVEIDTNDTWTRDYGPISTFDSKGNLVINDFKFNGWGLKFAADCDNLVTSKLWDKGIWQYIADRKDKISYKNNLGFILEGGSIESDGKGTIMTTSRCLLSLNRNGEMNKGQIEQELKNRLGAKRVLWIDHGELAGDDTDAHVDTLARFAPEDTIIYCGCQDTNDQHHTALMQMRQQLETFITADDLPYNLIELPLPDPIFDNQGERLPATYANFLITPTKVLLPVYNQPQKDLLAQQLLSVAFPDRKIIPVNCLSLIQQHGSLHCATMQIPSL